MSFYYAAPSTPFAPPSVCSSTDNKPWHGYRPSTDSPTSTWGTVPSSVAPSLSHSHHHHPAEYPPFSLGYGVGAGFNDCAQISSSYSIIHPILASSQASAAASSTSGHFFHAHTHAQYPPSTIIDLRTPHPPTLRALDPRTSAFNPPLPTVQLEFYGFPARAPWSTTVVSGLPGTNSSPGGQGITVLHFLHALWRFWYTPMAAEDVEALPQAVRGAALAAYAARVANAPSWACGVGAGKAQVRPPMFRLDVLGERARLVGVVQSPQNPGTWVARFA